MLIAVLVRGPYDGERLILPITDPWRRIVIPEFGKVQLQFFYLRAGPLEEQMWAYLFDDSYSPVTGDESPTR